MFWPFNSKVGRIATPSSKYMVCMQPLLKLKIRPRARPVSLKFVHEEVVCTLASIKHARTLSVPLSVSQSVSMRDYYINKHESLSIQGLFSPI